jgi:hypothetical protein
VDLDECLALLNSRNPYDASTCTLDTLNTPVLEVISCYQDCHPGHRTIIVTGRPERNRMETEAWLTWNNIYWDDLLMRDDCDWTSSAFYKWEAYREQIKDTYEVRAVFDDNPTVCRMFAEEGLTVFRVGNHQERYTD